MSIAEEQDGFYSSSLSSASDSPRMIRSTMWPQAYHRHQQQLHQQQQQYQQQHHPQQQQFQHQQPHHHIPQRPYLRLSNSSADLIETMGRQRMPLLDGGGAYGSGPIEKVSLPPTFHAFSCSIFITPLTFLF
jgi:hypothetical protein